MSKYDLVAGCFVLLIVASALIIWGANMLFPSARQEREDEEAYGDASLLDRDGGGY